MKKIIGILGVAVFVVTMFFNISIITNNSLDNNLFALTTITTASAENGPDAKGSKYVYCDMPDGKTGYYIICDDHNDDVCITNPCSC